MKHTSLLLIGLILGFGGVACRRDEPATNPDFYCLQNPSPTPDSLFKLLQGRWKLYGEHCSDCSKRGINLIDGKEVILIFSIDSTMQLIENGLTIGPAGFSIVPHIGYPGTYAIKTDPALSQYTYGYIFKCGDSIGFTYAYLDGLTYFFKRQPQ